ncbi:hypothetical protein KQX54_017258 [Cotesia glomerata]|uniref:Uncharacterized protein n=1 Tax=Cotesia glomerata TaxID=32391 RepID=A0AAV7IG23_COTGL|nr:hypothetical protein KQX54_017258 [Cotesia glomerata]
MYKVPIVQLKIKDETPSSHRVSRIAHVASRETDGGLSRGNLLGIPLAKPRDHDFAFTFYSVESNEHKLHLVA